MITAAYPGHKALMVLMARSDDEEGSFGGLDDFKNLIFQLDKNGLLECKYANYSAQKDAFACSLTLASQLILGTGVGLTDPSFGWIDGKVGNTFDNVLRQFVIKGGNGGNGIPLSDGKSSVVCLSNGPEVWEWLERADWDAPKPLVYESVNAEAFDVVPGSVPFPGHRLIGCALTFGEPEDILDVHQVLAFVLGARNTSYERAERIARARMLVKRKGLKW